MPITKATRVTGLAAMAIVAADLRAAGATIAGRGATGRLVPVDAMTNAGRVAMGRRKAGSGMVAAAEIVVAAGVHLGSRIAIVRLRRRW